MVDRRTREFDSLFVYALRALMVLRSVPSGKQRHNERITTVQSVSKKKMMPCFLPSISPLPSRLKKAATPTDRRDHRPFSFHNHSCHGCRSPQRQAYAPTDGQRCVGRAAPAVEKRLTQPRRLLRQLSDVDSGRLRRLIRSGDLALCFDAAEDAGGGSELCPICFYLQPSLNRSKCCGKGICTECFLQLMPLNSSKAVHCPFCKSASYAVEFRGAQTISDKKLEQEEEQNVNEEMKIDSQTQIAGELIPP